MQLRQLAVLALVGGSLLGCGGETSITGKVTLDGKPLPNAEVAFKALGGGPSAMGGSDESGNYQVQVFDEQKLQPGEFTATVQARQIPDAAAPSGPAAGPQAMEAVPQRITPDIYADPTTSPFKFTVKPGKNSINLDLKSN